MTKTMSVSVQLEPELNDQVAAVAAALDRPTAWVIEQALREHVVTEV